MLRQRLRAARTNDNGFTLIELLVVVAVIGILAGIVVFGVATFRADATTAACKAAQTTVTTATEAYLANTGAAAATFSAAVPPAAGSLQAGNYLKPGYAMPAGCALPTNVPVS